MPERDARVFIGLVAREHRALHAELQPDAAVWEHNPLYVLSSRTILAPEAAPHADVATPARPTLL